MNWLSPADVEGWLGSPYDLHPFTPTCPGCKIDCEWALEQFVRAINDDPALEQSMQVAANKWVVIRQITRLLVAAMDGGKHGEKRF